MDHPIRILHLEDNSRDAQLIHDLLDDAGLPCAIVRAINRPTFESALAQDSFDLILCDNNLPDYDGKAALALARARQPLTPVVIISGSLGEDEAVRSLQFGATDYLLKGRLERLIPAVRRALDEARERRQLQEAELELRRSEERMRLALAATNDAIWDWDLLAGTIVCNSTFEEAFGRPAPNSDVAAWWNDRVAPEEREDVSATLAAAIETAVPFWTKTYCLRRRDGRWAHVNNRVCLSTDATGRVVRLVGALQDITEAMEAEDQRNALEDQLRQAQKLEAIGTLAGGIAHDFNNILGIILANSDLARMDLVKLASTDHAIGESLGEITLAANRARDLVRQILTFSRRTDSTLSVMKVQPIVRECLKMLRSTIPPIVTIKQSVDPACACIVGDPTQLHQVVMNLCTNAWHALPARDGLIDVRVMEVDADRAPVEAQSEANTGRFVRISVSDNGHGMDARTKTRIFEPFFTTKAAGKGTGLGLAVVHGIMKAHGGVITVESEPGQGTTFHLYFPAQTTSAPAAVAADRPAPESGTGQRLLLVDDDVSMGRAMQRFLQRQGYEVDLFHTPTAAHEAFGEHPEKYDLVITDFAMPAMSGLDLTEAIKQIRPEIPVLLVTGTMGFSEQDRARECGLYEVLAKPVTPEMLFASVASALKSGSKPPAVMSGEPERARVLIIEDDAKFRESCIALVARAGYQPMGAANGTAALRLMRETPADIVVTDVLMPEGDGLETIVTLAQLHPGVPIIAMSGGGRIKASDGLAMCEALGVAATLTKPFAPEELIDAIIAALPAGKRRVDPPSG